jgi:hypothetical protein
MGAQYVDYLERTIEELGQKVEALHQIVQAYGEDEGYIPIRVYQFYDKYHRPWEQERDKQGEDDGKAKV